MAVGPETHEFQLGSFRVEPLNGYIVGQDQEPRHLPPKAMEVLVYLAASAPETLTRDQLLDEVWGRNYISDEVLTHAITELRHALGDSPGHPEYIETIPKRGYRLLEIARPPAGSPRHLVRNGRSPVTPGWLRRGVGLIQRNLNTSVLIVIGVLIGLSIILDRLPGKDDGFPTEHSPSIPTNRNLELEPEVASSNNSARELYLRALSLANRITLDGTGQAEVLLEQALSIDTRNAPAWSLLGRIYYRQAAIFRDRPLQDGHELARQAIQRALAIDPQYGPAYADLAFINLTFDFDFNRALQHLRRAHELSPADPDVLRVAARLEMTHAHVDHAIDFLERSVSLDPDSCLAHSRLGQAYYFANRLDDAEQSLKTSLVLNPSAVRSRYLLGLVLLAQDRARPALAAMQEEIDESSRLIGTAIVQYVLSDSPVSAESLESTTITLAGSDPYQVARFYALRGQHIKALDWLEQAYDGRDGELTYLLVDPLLADLRSDKRWRGLLRKLDLPQRTNPDAMMVGL